MLRSVSRICAVAALVAANMALASNKPLKAEQAYPDVCDIQHSPYTNECTKYCVDWIFTHCDGSHCANDCN